MVGFVEKFSVFCIRNRNAVVAILAVLTALLAISASRIDVHTVFSDMLPQSHTYVKTHEQFKSTFGGSNLVSIMLQVEKGDIFTPDVLDKVHRLTRDLQQVDGVNPFQIISLASKKLKEVKSSTYGIEAKPLMWPNPPQDAAGIAELRESVLNNPMAYGVYVSQDLTSTLITMDFYDHLVNYETAFDQIRDVLHGIEGNGVSVHVVGDPVLYGWVNYFLPETLSISLLTIAALAGLLFILSATWRGTLLPMLAGLVSSIWALGIGHLIGFNFDPLTVVVAFLISARSISHSVQLVTRFDDLVEDGERAPRDAARLSMAELFRPGMLGVIADAGAMIVVVLTPIPLLQKISVIGTVWVLTISVAAVVLTPVLLSWVRDTRGRAHPINLNGYMHRILDLCVKVVTTRARYVVLAMAAVVLCGSAVYAFNLQIGDARPGSPILWSDAEYNKDAKLINEQFQGADRMFVVFNGHEPDVVKTPEVLDTMRRFQRFAEAQPEIGGSVSLADVLSSVNQTLHEGNPRYAELGKNKLENGEYLYLYETGSEPGDLDRFTDSQYQDGAVTLFFRDHTGATLRTAIARIKEFITENPLSGADYQLAGGLVGVLAAVNEVLLAGQIEAIALALLVVVVCCTIVYRSSVAGIFFMVPILLSNTLTFAYMAWADIGMNINTVPVVALGIGLGVDYAFYIVDGIKEELAKHGDPQKAIAKSLHSAGRGVLVTGSTLIVSALIWTYSSLRFQAEMGLLISLWLTVSVFGALFIMPALAYVFRPKFIFGDPRDIEVSREVMREAA